jgi:hypothetical protein
VGQLQQDARAIAGVAVGAGGRAVGQPLEDLQPALDDAARLLALDVRDEAHAAGVVLELRIVEAVGAERHGAGLYRAASIDATGSEASGNALTESEGAGC